MKDTKTLKKAMKEQAEEITENTKELTETRKRMPKSKKKIVNWSKNYPIWRRKALREMEWKTILLSKQTKPIEN